MTEENKNWNMVRKSITITREQEEFLKKNRMINLSGFVQEKLDELMKKYGGEVK